MRARSRRRPPPGAARPTPGALAALLALGAAACGGRAHLETELDAGSDVDLDAADAPFLPPVVVADKLDLLLVVDNSRNMDTAIDLLSRTVPYLLERLRRPACVNGLGHVVAETVDPFDPCPVGVREFRPLLDVRAAVISTSLGGHGADTCSTAQVNPFHPTMNDGAHLLARDPGGGVVPTYAGKGFLAWDPAQKLAPPGDADPAGFSAKLGAMIAGVGERGCGFEAQLESMYRFLVEPDPHQTVTVQGDLAVQEGTDTVLLAQRRDFLRHDSALAILLITDENDCSIVDGGSNWLVAQGMQGNVPFRMPRARSACQKDPLDPCCFSCAQVGPASCPPSASDPECQKGVYTELEDPLNLRCFDQKRRFGHDFLHPISRYVSGLRDGEVVDRHDARVPNPIFSDLAGLGRGARSPDLVAFGAIVGVPWQDLAVDPDLLELGYLPPSQIDWALVLGDPATATPPLDPLMRESIDPRTGVNPPTGAPLAPPEAPSPTANPVNGHERLLPRRDDLQYACVFPRPAAEPCSQDGPPCECLGESVATNPICQGPEGGYAEVQRLARALPGTRLLEVVRELGDQAVAASICAHEVVNEGSRVFGYKPAVDALLRRLRGRLNPPP